MIGEMLPSYISHTGNFRERVDLLARDTKKIDAKGRFFIPARQKETLGAELVITNSLDKGFLCVYSKEHFKYIVEQLSLLPSGEASRRVRRFIEGESREVVVDSQGRISVTPDLWKRIGAKAGDEICVYEYDNKLEICTKETYEATGSDLGDISELEAMWSVKGL